MKEAGYCVGVTVRGNIKNCDIKIEKWINDKKNTY
jgi:hypothetical protein